MVAVTAYLFRCSQFFLTGWHRANPRPRRVALSPPPGSHSAVSPGWSLMLSLCVHVIGAGMLMGPSLVSDMRKSVREQGCSWKGFLRDTSTALSLH